MVLQTWIFFSGSIKLVDQKKRWIYTINPYFFRLEKSVWPEKKIRVWRTTFLEPLFYTFLETRLQNKWSIAKAATPFNKFENQIVVISPIFFNARISSLWNMTLHDSSSCIVGWKLQNQDCPTLEIPLKWCQFVGSPHLNTILLFLKALQTSPLVRHSY